MPKMISRAPARIPPIFKSLLAAPPSPGLAASRVDERPDGHPPEVNPLSPDAPRAWRGSAARGRSSSGSPPRGSAPARRRCRRPSRAGARGRRRGGSGRPARSSTASRSARPAAGPSAIAAATARLSVTTGLPVIRSSSPYSARICGQSVSSAVAPGRGPRRSRPGAGTRRPRPCAIASSSSAIPSAMRARSHSVRSWSGERDQVARRRPSGRGGGRR